MLTTTPAVNVTNNYLEICNLQLHHPEVANYLNSFAVEDQISEITKIIEVGAMILSRVNTSNHIDYVDTRIAETLHHVQDHFRDFDQQMKNILEAQLNPSKSDSFLSQATDNISSQSEKVQIALSEVLRSARDSIRQDAQRIEEGRSSLDKKMDPDNTAGYLSAVIQKMDQFDSQLAAQFNETDTASFVGKLRKAIHEHFGDEGRVLQLIESKFQLEGSTPLNQVYSGLRQEITLLRDAVMKLLGQQEMLQETTKKGLPFEAVVYERLQEIAKPHSDVVEDTSLKVEALSGSKKGDYVYYLAETETSITIDAKNYNKLKSLPAMLTYLKEAMKERGSKIGIIVAPEAKNLQKQIGSWNVFGSCIITCLDNLGVAIKYAKFILRVQETEATGINIGLVKHKLESVQRKMKEFTNVKSKLTKIANGVTSSVADVQNILDNLKQEINEKLLDIQHEFDRQDAKE